MIHLSEEPENFMLPEGADDVTPTNEPKLTQLDDASRSIILNGIYKYKYLQNNETGALIKTIDHVIYPELEKALSYAGSHLNSVMNYWRPQGIAEIMFWEGLFYDPLCLYYSDDPSALRILDSLNMILRRSIIGGSIGGSHQVYNVKMAGAHRTFEVRRDDGNK